MHRKKYYDLFASDKNGPWGVHSNKAQQPTVQYLYVSESTATPQTLTIKLGYLLIVTNW